MEARRMFSFQLLPNVVPVKHVPFVNAHFSFLSQQIWNELMQKTSNKRKFDWTEWLHRFNTKSKIDGRTAWSAVR